MTSEKQHVAVVGGGPAGLMAAEILSAHGVQVALYDAMPSVGRKFLLAGKGGMNLTHTEPHAAFMSRYGAQEGALTPMLQMFDAQALRAWAHALGIETFVGTSGRVFPTDMKAAPLLRAWLKRLRDAGVQFHMRHRWLGWQDDQSGDKLHNELRFATPAGDITARVDATLLALGGASWPRLGSDASWVPLLQERAIDVAALKPANCGFDTSWSGHFCARHAGEPVKAVIARCTDRDGNVHQRQGEFVVTETGVEGSLIYALSAFLRDRIEVDGHATLTLDLAPGKSLERVVAEIAQPRGARSMSSHLQSKAGINGVKAGLLRELATQADYSDPVALGNKVKALPLKLLATRPIDEAISSAGGVRFSSLDEHLMMKALPGTFCAGEMLDWEAPTGGYLLTACFATGRHAALGVVDWLSRRG